MFYDFNPNEMFTKLAGHVKEFCFGAVGGGFAGGGLVYLNKIVFLDYLGRFGTIAFSALIGGMFTALAADIYKHHIRKKLFKQKQNERQETESNKVA